MSATSRSCWRASGAEFFAVGASLQPLSRSARRRAAGRRHRALPLASRLLQPAHRRGAGARRPSAPIDCWSVEQRDGKVFVKEKRADAGQARAQAERQGAGQDRDRGRRRGGLRGGRDAAARAVQGQHRHAERRRCRAGRSAEPSKDYLAGNAPEEWVPLRGDDFYAENGIDLRLKADVAEHRCARARGRAGGRQQGRLRPAAAGDRRRAGAPAHSRRRTAAGPHAAQPRRQPRDHRAGQVGASAPW